MNKLKLQWCLKLELLNGALGFSKSGLELELVHLNVFSLGNTLSLVLASPHIRLLVSLVDLSQEITLDASLFLQMVLDTIKLMFEVLEFAKKGSPLLCFIISNMSGFTQLGFELDLQFGHHVSLVLKFLDLFQQVSVFSGNLPLVVFKVSKSKVGLFNLLVSFIEGSKQALVGFLSRSLGSANLISGSTNILDFMHESGFLLLNLGLHLGKLVNLFRHLSNSILMLLLQADEGGGLLDVGFFQILPQLANLSLPLLVELNLSVGCTSSLIESLTKALKLFSKIRPLPLSLGPGLPLSFQFFFQFFYSRLDLLDGFLDLANKLLLIVQFARKTSEVLFLPLDGTLCLLLLPLQLRDLPAPSQDLPRPLQGGRQHPGDVRDIQVQQATHRDKQEEDLQVGDGPGGRAAPLVWYRAGVHPAGPGPAPLWLAQERVPRAPGSLLLWCGGRQGLRPGHCGGSLPRLSLCRHQGLRHQRRGDARPVGVPGRAHRGHRHGRRPLDLPLPSLQGRGGLRGRRQLRPEADAGRLERGRGSL